MKIRNKKINIILIVFFTIVWLGGFTACKREYIVGGVPHDVNMYKNMTSYEVLKSLPQFDTLVQLIDAAGFKDKINQSGSTFFAVTNGTVFNYLNQRTLVLQNTVNQTKKFLLDSLTYYLKNNIKGTADSLGMYLIPDVVVSPEKTTSIGTIYPSALSGNNVIVSFESTRDGSLGYYSSISSVPRILYFTQLWKPYQLSPVNTAANVPASVGVHTRVSTAFINTRNGVINVLTPGNTLFFFGTR